MHGHTRYILQLNGEFILNTNPVSESFKKPFKYTREDLMVELEELDLIESDVVVIFAVRSD